MSKLISLTQGKFAIVDDADYERLLRFTWHYNQKTGYAVGEQWGNGKKIQITMHREVLHAPKGQRVDHENENKLDNQKRNLRFCTNSQNMSNRGKQKNNTSGYKGVFWSIPAKRWRAQIRVDRKFIHLGLFDSTIDAAKAYNKAAIELFGEFAHLNPV